LKHSVLYDIRECVDPASQEVPMTGSIKCILSGTNIRALQIYTPLIDATGKERSPPPIIS